MQEAEESQETPSSAELALPSGGSGTLLRPGSAVPAISEGLVFGFGFEVVGTDGGASRSAVHETLLRLIFEAPAGTGGFLDSASQTLSLPIVSHLTFQAPSAPLAIVMQ